MDADAPLKRDLTPGALRQRAYRERQKRCARVLSFEADMEIVTALVAAGFLRDGDAGQRSLNQAAAQMARAWLRTLRS